MVNSTHWLVHVVRRKELPGSSRLEISPTVPSRDAWTMVARGLGLSDADLARMVAEYFRLEVADLSRPEAHAVTMVPESLVRRHLVLPVAETDRYLYVATSDPTDVEAERLIGFRSGRTPVFRIAPPSVIADAIDGRFSPNRAAAGILSAERVAEDAVSLVEASGPESISEEDATATPVVKLTNMILRDGIVAGASDIHIEPGRKIGAVRYRVDGVLRKHMDLPMSPLNRVISRIKILSRLDIADRLRPQDGRARVRIGELAYDLRVSTLPAAGAEKCVIRVLDSNQSFTLDDLAVPEYELARLRSLLALRDGVVIVTGPTGSGKTTTLYGALREIATGDVNIMTVEDPIEYEVEGITQTQVEVKQGVTFASTLRAILRQDPDVILVGEIRDLETAEVAAQAALTGHLVLATVHANDAVGAVARLADLGLDYATIASSLRGCVAQRLVRRVCQACVQEIDADLTPDERRLADRYGGGPKVRAVGCLECGGTGYRGRIPVIEVLQAGPRIQEAIELRKGGATLAHLAHRGGMRGLRQVAMEWVRGGHTTLEEVERVLGQVIDEEEAEPETPTVKRALLVDDDPEDRLFVRTLLERNGYRVDEAESGVEAWERLRTDHSFSIVILDLQMPDLEGEEVLNRIRGAQDTLAVPVLIRTGADDPEVEARLLRAGADEYVNKRAAPDLFLARIEALLRRSAL